MTQSVGDEVRAMLAEMPIKPRQGKLERWLEADPVRAKRFWAFIEIGQEEGRSIEELLSFWATKQEPCPVRPCRIRERLRERNGSA